MLQALSFLTIIGRSGAPTARATNYFPIVGAFIGIAIGAAWWGAGTLWPPLLAAVFAVTADVVITGMLHLDGLADSGDGLLAPMDRERRLTVMRDPNSGAFGVITLVVVLLLRTAAFASIPAGTIAVTGTQDWLPAAPLMLGALWCMSRTTMAVATQTLRYARASGIVSMFTGQSRTAYLVPLLVGVAISVALAIVSVGAWGLLVLGLAVAGMASVFALARVRLGGFTGDVLGAAGVFGETVGLVAWAAL